MVTQMSKSDANMIAADCVVSAPAGEPAELLQACLALMRGLETSLQGSRKALLVLDLAGLERGTCEQIGLVRELALIQMAHVASLAPGREPVQAGIPAASGYDSGMKEEFRRSGNRILQATRLHAALLARVQRKLCILAHVVAGPSAPYGPSVSQSGARPAGVQRGRRI